MEKNNYKNSDRQSTHSQNYSDTSNRSVSVCGARYVIMEYYSTVEINCTSWVAFAHLWINTAQQSNAARQVEPGLLIGWGGSRVGWGRVVGWGGRVLPSCGSGSE